MDKTSKMLRLWKQGHEILMHEYGLVRHYLKRDLDETDASLEVTSSNNLEKSLKYKFTGITDPQHALAALRKIRGN